MAYKVARTEIPGMSFRPFNERLGAYKRASIVIPTQSYPNEPSPGPVSGGLGQGFDLSSIPWYAWAAGALVALAVFTGGGRRR